MGSTGKTMTKPTVYVDTAIISAYWFEGEDLIVSARRLMTRQWWADERKYFMLFTSSESEREFHAGRYPRQNECVRMNARLNYLSLNKAVRTFGQELIELGIVPSAKPSDAIHLAVASIHEVDYLLTWNYAHLANPDVQDKLRGICETHGLSTPFLVSPESIPWASRGERIKRRKERS
jgi:predicted nucleic acid-binding protein